MAFTCPVNASHGSVNIAQTDHVGGTTNKVFELTCGDFIFDKSASNTSTPVKTASGTQITSAKLSNLTTAQVSDPILTAFMQQYRRKA